MYMCYVCPCISEISMLRYVVVLTILMFDCKHLMKWWNAKHKQAVSGCKLITTHCIHIHTETQTTDRLYVNECV